MPDPRLRPRICAFCERSLPQAEHRSATRPNRSLTVHLWPNGQRQKQPIDRKTDKIIAVDRQTALVVDLTESIAGKAAIQEAAAILAERILPRLVK